MLSKHWLSLPPFQPFKNLILSCPLITCAVIDPEIKEPGGSWDLNPEVWLWSPHSPANHADQPTLFRLFCARCGVSFFSLNLCFQIWCRGILKPAAIPSCLPVQSFCPAYQTPDGQLSGQLNSPSYVAQLPHPPPLWCFCSQLQHSHSGCFLFAFLFFSFFKLCFLCSTTVL